MIDFSKLNKENALIAMAVNACIGAISPNMRMVSFSYSGINIDMYFDLRKESDDDREEASDIADDLSVLTENYRVTPHVRIVGNEQIRLPIENRIIIYKQR